MRKALLLLLPLLLAAGGCSKKAEQPATLRISPGLPRHFDVGDESLKRPLPEDVADGYLQFGEAPECSYGLMTARRSVSKRSHERSDLVLYVYSGYGWFHVGEKDFYGSVGDIIYIPRGAAYSADNKSQNDFQFVMVFSPPLNPDDVVYYNDKDNLGADSGASSAAPDSSP